MRILIDLQGAQSESRFRGIGRYSLALALGVARNAGEHEIWVALNGALAPSIADLRRAFDGLVPQERIGVFDIVAPVAEIHSDNVPRCRAGELLREHFIEQLAPDAVLVTSLFEGYIDDAVVSVGRFAGAAHTAVVLYDLIPFLNPNAYLGTPEQRQHYAGKIASLQRAGLLLAISDYTRIEAIDALGLDPQRVVAISTAVDESFQPAPPGPGLAGLRERLGITRAAIMYAPGGFDARKNIDGLITAYGLLPAALRAEHQLVIASKLGEHERRVLSEHAQHQGLAPDELVLTGYVSDADLIALYRNAALFVFPSKHEGFGLPALEAMACGAIVIGADNTSIPEVIGCKEALFDAASPAAIAAKIGEVLTDAALRERLRAHGRTQAAAFSWDATAKKALAAMAAHHARAAGVKAPAAPAARRPRLAFVSPLPPERSGIADYAVQLLPALLDHFEIDLIVAQPNVMLPAPLAALTQHPPAWLDAHAAGYDHILYQFGNHPLHAHMFALLREHPGVVVLHDFFLGDVLAYRQSTGEAPGAWTDALYHAHGYPALATALGENGVARAREDFPCNLEVLEHATRVIVHSEHARELACQWYGAAAVQHWDTVPLPRLAPVAADRRAARAALGVRPDTFLVCSFGFIAPTKLTHELVQAWLASPLGANPGCELVLVGANHAGDYGLALKDMLRVSGAGERIRIAGWTSEAVYGQYLQAADAGVQLRSVSRGETSAAVLDCMNHGLPTLVNDQGSMRGLPDDAVWKLAAAPTQAELAAALAALYGDGARRAAIGARAAELIHTRHSPASCAHQYAAVLARAADQARHDRRALIDALLDVPGLPHDGPLLQELAHCLASAPDPLRPRQLLVDVTNIARHDLKTGIERVVRHQLLELLRRPLPGLRVEPVFLSHEGGQAHYRYARTFTRALLGIPGAADDAAIDLGPSDHFYSADYSPGTVLEAARAGVYGHMRERGVRLSFLVYDLLPLLAPQFFPANADTVHGAWLEAIHTHADTLLCISHAVMADLRHWMAQRPAGPRQPATAVLQLGADLDTAAPHQPGTRLALPAQLAGAPTFLVVGTIEPRKGHLQALAAFERLWARGVEANLLIVGKEGWLPLTRGERRTIPAIVEALGNHPQRGHHLFWMTDIDDAGLEQVYAASTCLLAPSEGEGFGLPLIEAARHGLPLLVRDLPVFREVAGTHACYFSGLEADDLAGAVAGWLALHDVGRHPASTGLASPTWGDNARQLLERLQLQAP